MFKSVIFALFCSLGMTVAAPLKFHVVPASGLAMWGSPLVMPDADALQEAELAADKALERYRQGLAGYREYCEARLKFLYLLEPLKREENAMRLHRAAMFEAASDKCALLESLYQNDLASDSELHAARLEAAWLWAHCLEGLNEKEYGEKLEHAAKHADMLVKCVEQGLAAGQNSRADYLLATAAAGEIRRKRNPESYSGTLKQVQKTYDELAGLMTARAAEGMAEQDAAGSAAEAARMFRRESEEMLRSCPAPPELLHEYCGILRAMCAILKERVAQNKEAPGTLLYAEKLLNNTMNRLRN